MRPCVPLARDRENRHRGERPGHREVGAAERRHGPVFFAALQAVERFVRRRRQFLFAYGAVNVETKRRGAPRNAAPVAAAFQQHGNGGMLQTMIAARSLNRADFQQLLNTHSVSLGADGGALAWRCPLALRCQSTR
ncbi:MAG: hypothetical protein NTZ05_01650 [Chloroflexi bacterium]|nr:hypothetical protein [Chloroflexota bacterium]